MGPIRRISRGRMGTRTLRGICSIRLREDLRRTQQAGGTNVMPDLAYTMKSNPKMKVMLAGGYYDLATPFFEGMYEMHHLPIPQKLQANISYHYYQSGHMVYVNEDVLKQFHADVAAFIRGLRTGSRPLLVGVREFHQAPPARYAKLPITPFFPHCGLTISKRSLCRQSFGN